MTLYDAPSELLEKLKCSLCYEYLSYPPITLYAETGSVCGRCPILETEKSIQPLREKSYEELASILTFPCRYRSSGCSEHLTIQDMPLHEQSCSFKPYFCPVLPLGSCAWQGFSYELFGHFATEHQIFLLEDPMFELDTVHNHKTLYLIPMFDELFLMRIEFDNTENLLRGSVYLVGNPQDVNMCQYEYKLQFNANGDTNTFWAHQKNQVEFDVDILKRTNDSVVYLKQLEATLNNPSFIICKVIINELEYSTIEDGDKNEVNINKNTLDSQIKQAGEFTNKMKENMECPVCQEFMVSPIFQCVTGHSVCGVCKKQLKECPTCRGKIENTRNFTLENIIESMEHYCKYEIDGCNFVTTLEAIRKHELECQFRPTHCPLSDILDCEWIGKIEKCFAHAKKDHPEKIQNNFLFEIIYDPSCTTFEEMMLRSKFNHTFRIWVSYCHKTNLVSCTVQCLTSPKDNEIFMYELVVVDCNNTGLKLQSKKYCGFWGDKKDDLKHCTIWSLDMVKPFMGSDVKMLKMRCFIT